jgi:hypothetical protein
VYDDWDAVSLLLDRLDEVMGRAGFSPDILLVDDGSTRPAKQGLTATRYEAISRVDVLRLRRNMGHQRAIAIALAYVQDRIKPSAVVIMDGDGEDAPEDVPRLVRRLEETGGVPIVFAERQRRSESVTFRLFYGLYRLAHRLLTGIPVKVGNFSVVPASQLDRLVVVSELWNHYAAAVFKARLSREAIPTTRATRLAGPSRMNFVALIGHGLSAMSVHAETIGVRLLVLAGIAASVVTALLVAVVVVRFFTGLAIPGWATNAAGILLLVLMQAISFAIVFAFLILHGRSQPSFIPIRDYTHFVGGVDTLADARVDVR